jgi:hypothetical protein
VLFRYCDRQKVTVVGDPTVRAQLVHRLRGGVYEHIWASGHAQAAPDAVGRLERQPGLTKNDAASRQAVPVAPVPRKDQAASLRQPRERRRISEDWEELGQVILLCGVWNVTEDARVVPIHLTRSDWPVAKSRSGEGHYLSAPDVAEAAVCTRDEGSVHLAGRPQLTPLTCVPEREV